MKEQPKFVISGGGTGGHIFPAIAIADTLKKKFPQAEILFIGAKGRMEMEKVPKAGYPIEGLWISGLTRDYRALTLPLKLISSFSKARRILKRFKPDVVIGVGGYASAPTLKMASWLGIPTVLQEQNSIPGKTNHNLGKRAKAICVAYPNMERWFPAERIVLTGNPLRSIAVANASRTEAAEFFHLNPEKPVAFLVGGSQGSRDMNYGIIARLADFQGQDLQFIWQTGKDYLEMAQAEVKALHLEEQVKPVAFIERMDLAYSLADVVVSRAGAMSISELALVQKPVIFVPLPTAAEDHQTKNAMHLADAGAAIIVKNEKVKEELVPALFQLCSDKEKQATMKANIAQFARPHAADDIVEVIAKLIQK
jgi:UDP-N-acetylglucosamine--N-acetylmuramyl-(pentapeptide) pyrophosphoryl-undecaprenol N-acetylglucosamine transferase